MNHTANWIAVDWGSSNLRAWALDAADSVVSQTSSPHGMLGLATDEFEGVLLETVADWLPARDEAPIPVLICGMAGARQGWAEADYLALNEGDDILGRLGSRLTPVNTRDSRLQVRIVPGLCEQSAADTTDAAGEAFDVMRGEETQLAGLVATQPHFSGAVCLPGTHSKWARLNHGNIEGFTTFMSGELFNLLSQDSVLKHSVKNPLRHPVKHPVGSDDLSQSAQRAAYLAGIDTALAAPARLSAELFGIRARDLLDSRLPEGDARRGELSARLSGLILGLELAGATASLPTGSQVVLIGAEALCQRYRIALEHLGFAVSLAANADMILAGLGRIQRAATAV
ncbi:MAG: 2-dehydro-3-deoxygalactonokinase [Halomonas sp.]|nr:2-dehydro-3-deoxygalactonokinase [Halomonas sp.]MDN6297311.1 2-dehydro-3-deoxygalactonokinase [Halomonas sp.]MDN6315112.1 2-dehydro-3-deoxygalactonokinase [Halomonas sp.]MDN6336589.1 2-dehydro-3-deoxygalactonokinase [Halomonas sp.]